MTATMSFSFNGGVFLSVVVAAISIKSPQFCKMCILQLEHKYFAKLLA